MGDEGISLSERSVARTEKPWLDLIRRRKRISNLTRPTGWPWWSETKFCWLYFWSSSMFPNCSAISAQFSLAQAELGRQWNKWKKSQQNLVSIHYGHLVYIWLWKSSDARWWDQPTEINWMAGTYPLTLETTVFIHHISLFYCLVSSEFSFHLEFVRTNMIYSNF